MVIFAALGCLHVLYPNVVIPVPFDPLAILLFGLSLLFLVGPASIRAIRKLPQPSTKRWVGAGMAVCLVGVRLAFPSTVVDTTTVWLVAIAVALLAFPDLPSISRLVKRVKIGDAEIELLAQEVEKAAESSERSGSTVSDDARAEVDEVIRDARDNPRAALLLLASKLERAVQQSLQEAGVEVARRFMSVPRAVEAGVNAGVFPTESTAAFRDFWTVRNKVAHGQGFDVPDETIYSLISLGTQLLKIVSARRIAVSNVPA